MYRTLRSITLLAFVFVWTACADSPAAPTADGVDLVSTAAYASPQMATDHASLQNALDAVAASGGSIMVRGEIVLDAPLVYESDQPLTLRGARGARIVGPMVDIAAPSNSVDRIGEETAGDGLQILGEPDLTVHNLTFEGQSGHGIYFELTEDASGTVHIDMTNSHFIGQGLSGVWLEEQAGGSPGDPYLIESSASIHLDLRNVSVYGTGFAEDEAQGCRDNAEEDGCSWADFDGFRINEGGDGDITFDFRNVRVTGNAGDGIEFDEIGNGDVRGSVNGSTFDGNGLQPQFPADIEDGFDIDEAGAGGIHLVMRGTSVSDNIDEGVDLDEADDGDVFFEARGLVATGNVDENIKVTEGEDGAAEADGNIILALSDVIADGSLDSRGARFEEFGPGDLLGYIRDSSFSDNTEDDAGSIDIELTRVEASGNDGQGLQMTENGGGGIVVQVEASTFTDNDNTAVEMEEEGDGGHDVLIRNSILIGSDGEESLEVIEADDGASLVVIQGGTIDPAPVADGDVTFDITP